MGTGSQRVCFPKRKGEIQLAFNVCEFFTGIFNEAWVKDI